MTKELFHQYILPLIFGLISWYIKEYIYKKIISKEVMLREEWKNRLENFWSPLYLLSGTIMWKTDENKEISEKSVREILDLIKKNAYLLPQKHYINIINIIEKQTVLPNKKVNINDFHNTRKYIYSQIEKYNYLLYNRNIKFNFNFNTKIGWFVQSLIDFLKFFFGFFIWIFLFFLVYSFFIIFSSFNYFSIVLMIILFIVFNAFQLYYFYKKHKSAEVGDSLKSFINYIFTLGLNLGNVVSIVLLIVVCISLSKSILNYIFLFFSLFFFELLFILFLVSKWIEIEEDVELYVDNGEKIVSKAVQVPVLSLLRKYLKKK